MSIRKTLTDTFDCPNCKSTMERHMGDFAYHCPNCGKVYVRSKKGELIRQLLRFAAYILEAILIIILRDHFHVSVIINLLIVAITIFPLFFIINSLDKYFIVEDNRKNK